MILDRIFQVGKFGVVLSTYNFAIGTGNDPAYKRLSEAGIGLVAMKVMAPANRRHNFVGKGSERMETAGGPAAAMKWVLRDRRLTTIVSGSAGIVIPSATGGSLWKGGVFSKQCRR